MTLKLSELNDVIEAVERMEAILYYMKQQKTQDVYVRKRKRDTHLEYTGTE